MADIFPSEQHRNVLLTTLKTLGVTEVEVEFNGGGDSGGIEAVTFMVGGHWVNDLPNKLVWPRHWQQFNPDTLEWEEFSENDAKPIKDIVEQIVYDALEATNIDYVNNDGGYGTFSVDLTANPPRIGMSVHVRRTETDDFDYDYTNPSEDDEESQ